jgi:hypothetical protein
VLRAVDCGNTKIRFVRFSTKHEFFEPLTGKLIIVRTFTTLFTWYVLGEETVSHYAVHNESSNSVGIYVFCSYCSVQILYAPQVNPVEVHVNVECLEKSTIDDIVIAYHASLESIPVSEELEPHFSKRGLGFVSTDMSLKFVWNLLHSYCIGHEALSSRPSSPDAKPKPYENEKGVDSSSLQGWASKLLTGSSISKGGSNHEVRTSSNSESEEINEAALSPRRRALSQPP